MCQNAAHGYERSFRIPIRDNGPSLRRNFICQHSLIDLVPEQYSQLRVLPSPSYPARDREEHDGNPYEN
jgi:hypothetical protein